MSVQKIDYENKIGLQNDENIPNKNKVTDEDMNEIKETINNNADELTTAQQNIKGLQSDQSTASGDITSLKNRVTALETDNTTNKQDINTLKTDNETNKSNIATLQTDNETNKTNISTLQEDVEEIESNITELQTEQTAQNKKIQELDDNQIHVTTEKANNINIKDASGQNAKIKLFGVSKQEGTPSPENVVEIQNTTGDIEITDCNENLVLNGYSTPKTDESFWNTTSSRFEPLKDGWGKYVLNNTSSATQYINSFINFSKFKNIIKANTQYKLLVEIRNASISQTTERDFFCVAGATSSEAFSTYFQISQFETAKFEKIITSKANFDNTTLLLRSFLSVSANNNVSLEIRISLLEANSTETEIKIGNQEYIFPLAQNQKMLEGSETKDDGIHHKRKQVELDGTEAWFLGVELDNTIAFGFVKDDKKAGKGLCNAFVTKMSGISTIDEEFSQFRAVGKIIYIRINKSRLTTKDVAGFKKWLAARKTAGTPVIVEYETTEETIEAYTEEQQEAYNQLQNAKTYKTVTNVFTDNAEVEMEYVAHTKTYIDNEINSVKEELNTIKELLSTTNTSAMLLDNMQTDLESEVL